MKTVRATVALLVAVAALGALSTAAWSPTSASPGVSSAAFGVSAARAGTSAISWHRCEDNRTLDCGRMTVPVDRTDASLGVLSLAMVRHKASNRLRRLGVLLVNPGGPGGSAIDLARSLSGSFLAANLAKRYDIIGVDPRGVGASSPVRCLDNASYDAYFAADPTPDDAAELATLVELSKSFADGCEKRNGERLGHLSTADTVLDMDDVRAALGESKISFLGFSYGTYLGLKYAERFPTRVGRFVLDGVLDPAASSFGRLRQQAAGFELALNDFLATCGKQRCTFVRDKETPIAAFERLMAGFETAPLDVAGFRGTQPITRKLGPSESMTGVLAALYNVQAGWPRLRGALNDAGRGDGQSLMQLFDLYADRSADGTFRNTSDANAAVNCTDLPADTSVDAYTALAVELQRTAPHFGAFAAYSSLLCAYWPKQGPAPAPVRARSVPPILLVGTTRDPATPYGWARNVAAEVANSRLLTYDGDGHTAFLTGNPCVVRAVEKFLLNSTVPAVGTVCE